MEPKERNKELLERMLSLEAEIKATIEAELRTKLEKEIKIKVENLISKKLLDVSKESNCNSRYVSMKNSRSRSYRNCQDPVKKSTSTKVSNSSSLHQVPLHESSIAEYSENDNDSRGMEEEEELSFYDTTDENLESFKLELDQQNHSQPSSRFRSSIRGAMNIVRNISFHQHRHVIFDTGGIYMPFIVAVIKESSTSTGTRNRYRSSKQWLVALVSLIIVLAQITVLFLLIVEASYPTCSTHDDCRIGEYCEDTDAVDYFKQPRCIDCNILLNASNHSDWEDHDCSAYRELDENVLVWVTSDSTWYPKALYEDPNAIPCLKHLHCQKTNIGSMATFTQNGMDDMINNGENIFEHSGYYDRCDHLRLSMTKFSWSHQIVFFFVAFLFAAIMCQEIDECVVEEALLSRGLRRIGFQNRCFSPAELVRVSLRLRKFILPWWVVAAAGSIMVVDSLSAKNILLNLFAIGFITEGDNLFGIMFLTEGQRKSVERHVDMIREQGGIEVSFIWSRILGILPVVVMFLVVSNIESLLELHGGKCSSLSTLIIFTFGLFSPVIVIILYGIWEYLTAAVNDDNYGELTNVTVLDRFLCCFEELSRNMNAFFIQSVFSNILAFSFRRFYGAELRYVLMHIFANCIGFGVNVFCFAIFNRGKFDQEFWNWISITFYTCFVSTFIAISFALAFQKGDYFET